MKLFITVFLAAMLLLGDCSAPAKPAEIHDGSVVETAPETVVPEETKPEPTEPKATEPRPTEPKATEPKPTEPKATEPKPTEPKATEPKPTEARPNYPTSSSTCKDTGSSKIWDYGIKYEQDYREETDETRSSYLQYLEYVNPYFYYFEDNSLRMYIGKTYGIPLIASREGMEQTVWTSSDPEVATVNQVGFVTPLKEGTVIITATFTDPESGIPTVRTCQVRVEQIPVYTFVQLEEMAKKEAKKIADAIMNDPNCTTDLERIAAAAARINRYVAKGKGSSIYEFVNGMPESRMIPGYNQPFGTLITYHSSCAGDVRALGMVLEYMGYEWYHVNANKWEHQWCIVYNVDGQTAFADGSMFGIAGYGDRSDRSNWMTYRNGELTPYG